MARQALVYTPWFWWVIMMIIRHLPWFIFKRLKVDCVASGIKIAVTARRAGRSEPDPAAEGRGYTNIVAIDKHPANTAILSRLHPDLTVIETDLARTRLAGAVAEADVVILAHAQIGGIEEAAFTDEQRRRNAARNRSRECEGALYGASFVVRR